MERSLNEKLTRLLSEAAQAHHVEVLAGRETDATWAPWYADYIGTRVRSMLTCMQGHGLNETPSTTVKARVSSNAWDGGPSYQAEDATNYSRLHVG